MTSRPGGQESLARGRAAVWLLLLAAVCCIGWRDSYRMSSYVWDHPELATCAAMPSLATVAGALPANGDVIFLGATPADGLDGDFFEYFRRFFCAQYVLAPSVLYHMSAAELFEQDVAYSATEFLVDARHHREETLGYLKILASLRTLTLNETPLSGDLVFVTMTSR